MKPITESGLGKHLSDVFPIKNHFRKGCALLPSLFNFALEYASRKVQVNQNGLKLNGTHRLSVYTDYILARNVRTIKKNIEALVDVTMETGLEVINDTKYVFMSSDQDAGQRI
jgi:hypothetical protein